VVDRARFQAVVGDSFQKVRSDLFVTDGVVSGVASSGNTVYIGGGFTRLSPATGSALAFDAGTGLPLGLPMVAEIVNSVAPDGNGGFYVGGIFTHVAGLPRTNLAHVLSNSTVDSWNPSPDNQVQTLLVSGGVLYVGGAFSVIGGQTRGCLAPSTLTLSGEELEPSASIVVNALAVSGGTVCAATFSGRRRRGPLAAWMHDRGRHVPSGANGVIRSHLVMGPRSMRGTSPPAEDSRGETAALSASGGLATA
jgi:hypothetical protein